jgi:hypothetical protein
MRKPTIDGDAASHNRGFLPRLRAGRPAVFPVQSSRIQSNGVIVVARRNEMAEIEFSNRHRFKTSAVAPRSCRHASTRDSSAAEPTRAQRGSVEQRTRGCLEVRRSIAEKTETSSVVVNPLAAFFRTGIFFNCLFVVFVASPSRVTNPLRGRVCALICRLVLQQRVECASRRGRRIELQPRTLRRDSVRARCCLRRSCCSSAASTGAACCQQLNRTPSRLNLCRRLIASTVFQLLAGSLLVLLPNSSI